MRKGTAKLTQSTYTVGGQDWKSTVEINAVPKSLSDKRTELNDLADSKNNSSPRYSSATMQKGYGAEIKYFVSTHKRLVNTR